MLQIVTANKPKVNLVVQSGLRKAGLLKQTALVNYSGKPKRPRSNLLVDKGFNLAPKDISSFVAFTKLNLRVYRDEQLWVAMMAEMLYPNLQQASSLTSVKKLRKDFIEVVALSYLKAACPQQTWIKKKETGFEILLPVMAVLIDAENNLNGFRTALGALVAKGEEAQLGEIPEAPLPSAGVSTNELKYNYLPAQVRKIFRALNATFVFKRTILADVMYLKFEVNKKQAEYLGHTPWDELRGIDIYGLARTWANAKRDSSIKPPAFTRPLADIAATLPAGGEPRTNEDGILVDQDGSFYYLPKEVNNISAFDTTVALSLSGPDGVVAQVQGEEIKKMPPPQMVLVDWVNMKWSFVTESGNLRVMDISRSIPATISHVKGLLSTPIVNEKVGAFVTKVNSIFVNQLGGKGVDIKVMLNNTVPALNRFEDFEGTVLQDVRLHHLFFLAKNIKTRPELNQYPELQTFGVFVNDAMPKVLKLLETNVEKSYQDYSVTGIAELTAILKICSKYGHDYDSVHTQDRAAKAKYTAPKVDPNYQMPAVPYMAQDRAMLPHQFKANNMMRDSPDNAILAVDAGGGKTPLGVFDVLKEMKDGLNGPFLIMCPSHLIPQYVIEFAYFTEGRVNCVPVTTYSIRTNGFDGLEAMIEAAPVNTVVLADYNLAKGSSKTKVVGYGTASTAVFAVVDFLRQFRFNYILCDEAHLLKNLNSAQAKAVGQLSADIKKKRLASGTFIANSEVDVATLFSYLDPTVFGTKEEFAKEFSASGTGGKITSLRPGAELEIKQRMQQNCRYVQIKRKEWAAILPPRVESFNNIVELTPAQRKVYDMILAKTKDELLEAAKSNSKLAMILGLVKHDEGDEDAIDEESTALMEGGIDELLKPYLSRLEKFLCAPAKDPLGDLELTGSDRISPKVAKFAEICINHLEAGIPGKILAFTNQVESAIEIYSNLPEELKSKTLLYAAADKEALGATFENDDTYQVMIGVGSSMEVGLNLQFCSRLIRCETVLSPAALEQGNSRIGRPNVKKAETRPATYYDWISVDSSIDMTKVAYLLTKKVRIACVEEADNPVYAPLIADMPPLFRLSLDNIAENNTRATLSEYLNPQSGMYRKYLMCVAQDYEEFRKRNPSYLTPDGKLKMVPLERSEDLEGSKIMRRVPYVPGLQLYKARDLGLVRTDDFLREDVSDSGDDEEEGVDVDEAEVGDDLALAKAKEKARSVIGLPVHTEYGEGTIVGVSFGKKALSVKLNSDGRKVRVKMLSAFIITKPQTSGKDIRNLLAKASGTIPLDTPLDVQDNKKVVPIKGKKGKVVEPVKPKAKQLSVSLRLVVSNDYIGLELDNEEDNKDAAKALRLMKFDDVPAHYFALLKTPQHFTRLMKAAAKIGLTPATAAIEKSLVAFNDAWLTMGAKAKTMFTIPTMVGLRNFALMNHRPNPARKEFSAYVSVEGEDVYLCLPATGNPGNKAFAANVKASGVQIHLAAPQLIRYFKAPSDLVGFIKQLINSGIEVTNEKELHDSVKKLYQQVRKATRQEPEDWFTENKRR